MILEPLTEEDLELVLAWRSIPDVYKFQASQKDVLSWEEHLNWFKNRKHREDYFIIYKNRKIGMVNVFNLDTDMPELGIYIGEIKLWGNGLASEAIDLLVDNLKKKGYDKICATTNKENCRSIKLWEKLGFKRKEEVKNGTEWLYVL